MYTFNINLFRIPLNMKDLNGLTLSVAANRLHRILLLAPRMEITQSSVFVTRNGKILINGKQNLKTTFIYCILTRVGISEVCLTYLYHFSKMIYQSGGDGALTTSLKFTLFRHPPHSPPILSLPKTFTGRDYCGWG